MKPNKIYLAARYSRRLELCAYREDLNYLGIEVTSRWLNGSHQIDNEGSPISELGEKLVEDDGTNLASIKDKELETYKLRQKFVHDDVEDLMIADTLIAFTEEPRSGNSRGGRHVELGIAIGVIELLKSLSDLEPYSSRWSTNRQIMVVGPRENLFTYLPYIAHYEYWQDCLVDIKYFRTDLRKFSGWPTRGV
jgi:hypothetical protein